MTAKGVPRSEQRCGKWMPLAKATCALPETHFGRCRTAEAMAASYARNVAWHNKLVAQRQAWVDEYKMRKGCIDCGYAEHPVALDFDHRDPELKTANVSALMSATVERIKAELDKCDVRCACCHRIRTHNLHHSLTRRRPGPGPEDRAGPADETTDHLPGQLRYESPQPPP